MRQKRHLSQGMAPKVLISGWHPELLEMVDGLEISASDEVWLSKSRLKKLNYWTRGGGTVLISAGFYFSDPERIGEIADRCETAQAKALALRVPKSMCEEPAELIEKIQMTWIRYTRSVPIYFDFHEGFRHPHTSATFDPAWDPIVQKTDYWKIHGWHETRWIRLYGEAQLRSLAKKALRHSPNWIVFSHSQRKIEGPQFRSMINQ